MLRIMLVMGLTVLSLTVAGPVAAADGPIILGAVYNQTGGQVAFDQPALRGAELAVSEANAAGGVLERQVELVAVDPESRPDQAAGKTTALLEAHPSISALLGLSDTDMVLGAARVAAEHRLVFVTSGATSPKLPAEVPTFLFLACFGDNVQASAAAEYAFDELGARTVAVLYNSTTTYTTLLQGYFRARFEELGGKVLWVRGYQAVDGAGADLEGLDRADGVFLSAQEPGEAVDSVTKLRQAGFTGPILGGDGYDDESAWAGQPSIGKVYFTTHVDLGADNADQRVRAFDKAYREAFAGPAPDGFAALGYDAAGLLLAAIDKAKSAEPAAVLEALAGLEDYRGVTGTISFAGGSRIPRKSVTILEVEGGRTRFVRQMTPERAPPP